MFPATVVSSLLGSCAEQTWSAERCWMAQEEVTWSEPHCHELVEWTQDRQQLLLIDDSSNTCQPFTACTGDLTSFTVVSAFFSTVSFNAIAAWGQTTLQHSPSGYITIVVLMTWSLPFYLLNNTEVFIYCWTCNICGFANEEKKKSNPCQQFAGS